jgi:predicted NAD-dependent protein-ADP-ribosyltransferase YbiA (DUF1768 family)
MAVLRAILLATGDAKIVDHTDDDSCCGDGADGNCKTWLGRILMEIREELQSDKEQVE